MLCYPSGSVVNGTTRWVARTNFFTEAGYKAKESFGREYGRYEYVRGNMESVSDTTGMESLMDGLRCLCATVPPA